MLKIERKQYDSINFLFYSYFGFEIKDNTENVLSLLIDKAFIDATNQGAFNALIKKDKTELKEAANRCKKKTIELLTNRFNNLKKINIKNYKEWHTNICQDVIKEYSECNKDMLLWTYGNSQKILNMSVKYIILFGNICDMFGINNEITIIANELHKIENDLDIPVDSFIIEAIWGTNNIRLPYNDKAFKNDAVLKKYSSERVEGWSKWDENKYKIFMKSLHDYFYMNSISPLEWESENWLKISKRRKNR